MRRILHLPICSSLMSVSIIGRDRSVHCRSLEMIGSGHPCDPVVCGPSQSAHFVLAPGGQSRRSCSPPQCLHRAISLHDQARWPIFWYR